MIPRGRVMGPPPPSQADTTEDNSRQADARDRRRILRLLPIRFCSASADIFGLPDPSTNDRRVLAPLPRRGGSDRRGAERSYRGPAWEAVLWRLREIRDSGELARNGRSNHRDGEAEPSETLTFCRTRLVENAPRTSVRRQTFRGYSQALAILF
jgi:hypothetical protein